LNPRISIELTNFRPFFFSVEVEKRESYPCVNALTFAQAVAIAGGYTYRASRSRLTVQRAKTPKQESAGEGTPVLSVTSFACRRDCCSLQPQVPAQRRRMRGRNEDDCLKWVRV
jgi:protein involved in polysaccharide export with SLBB domain